MGGRKRGHDRGFILPLSIMLVLVLTVSGTSFMHHDYLERVRTLHEVDNHGSFYLASAGIERSRETFKIPSDFSWTSVLQNMNPNYPVDTNTSDQYYSLLCPVSPCVIPSFQAPSGAPVTSGMPFDATFAAGLYSARAFNDDAPGETSTVDLNKILVLRALGTVRNEIKLLEAQIKAVSALKHINCLGPIGSSCPDRVDGNPPVDSSEGKEPAASPVLPFLEFPLNDNNNYYRDFDHENFGPGPDGVDLVEDWPTIPGDHTFKKGAADIADRTHYYVTGNVTLQQVTGDSVVIFSTGNITVKTGTVLTNAILVASGDVNLQAGATLSAPLPHPVIIAGDDVTQGSGTVTVFGNVYAIDTINANPVDIHGVLIGGNVEIQGSSRYTDKDASGDTPYYDFMPGFFYPPEMLTTEVEGGTWLEIQ